MKINAIGILSEDSTKAEPEFVKYVKNNILHSLVDEISHYIEWEENKIDYGQIEFKATLNIAEEWRSIKEPPNSSLDILLLCYIENMETFSGLNITMGVYKNGEWISFDKEFEQSNLILWRILDRPSDTKINEALRQVGESK